MENPMNRTTLLQLRTLLNQATKLIEYELAALPTGPIPEPGPALKVERMLWSRRDKLVEMKEFTAPMVRRLIRAENGAAHVPSSTAFSQVLSNWVAAGYVVIVESGTGRRPTIYKMRE